MALVFLSTHGLVVLTVEGGQRAIVFNRIGGMQMDTVLAEGLHFRFHILIHFTGLPVHFNFYFKNARNKN